MKINTIFLLTVVGVFATFSLLTMLTTGTSFNAVAQSNETAAITINETAANPSNETAANPSNETAANHFTANLTAPVMVSDSDATGNGTFTLKDDGNTMYYVVSATGLKNVSQVVITQSTGGRTTDLVQPLYYSPTSGLYTNGSGTADGNFTSANFVDGLKGKPMTELVKKIIDGDVYLAIKSVDYPLAEIAGKIQPVR
ncbi:MAG TPA: CHRD domain-containing protein [Candidatus Nitrosocosmicus sp.]|nr:CHRD domain-containing protein [Candidatus Nitrosocosmicus sp.]